MKAKLALLPFNVMNSFWFAPGLILAGAIMLSVLMLELDRAFADAQQQGRAWLLPVDGGVMALAWPGDHASEALAARLIEMLTRLSALKAGLA